jgi:hypothetical protein
MTLLVLALRVPLRQAIHSELALLHSFLALGLVSYGSWAYAEKRDWIRLAGEAGETLCRARDRRQGLEIRTALLDSDRLPERYQPASQAGTGANRSTRKSISARTRDGSVAFGR